jgi:hypothetical protein
MSPSHLKRLAVMCGVVLLAVCALAVLSSGALRASEQVATLAACLPDEPCNAQYRISGGNVNAIGGRQESAQQVIEPSKLAAVSGALTYNVKRVDQVNGGTLVYTDTQSLTTTIEVPPAAVSLCTELVYSPLLTPTEALDLGDKYAQHAFFLHTYPCANMLRVYLPIVRWSWHLTPVMRGTTSDTLPAGPTTAPFLAPGDPVFQEPVTMTIHYSDADVTGIDENTLWVVYWTGSAWEDMAGTCGAPPTYGRDLDNNHISFTFCHMSQGALVGN